MSDYILDLRPPKKPTRPVDTVLFTKPNSLVTQSNMPQVGSPNWWGAGIMTNTGSRSRRWSLGSAIAAGVLLISVPIARAAHITGYRAVNRPVTNQTRVIETQPTNAVPKPETGKPASVKINTSAPSTVAPVANVESPQPTTATTQVSIIAGMGGGSLSTSVSTTNNLPAAVITAGTTGGTPSDANQPTAEPTPVPWWAASFPTWMQDLMRAQGRF